MKVRTISAGALALAMALVQAGPSRSEARVDVAGLYRKSYLAEAQGKQQEALDAMKAIHARAGDSYFVNARTAWLAYLAGHFAESQEAYQHAIASEPKAIEPKLGLTLPLLASKDWKGLERACRDVLALDPKNNVARSRLGLALYSQGNYPDALTTYRSLVADYPGDLDHRTGLAWALLKTGKGKEAKQIFSTVLAVSPDNASAKLGIKQ